jgi:uncharacterized protein (UPF0276 family)
MSASLHGLGVGWRPPLAAVLAERRDLAFVEVIAEHVDLHSPVPAPLAALSVPVVAHGVGLSLGGAEPLEAARVSRLAHVAEHLGSPLVSEHIAFVRAGGVEAGHLLPVPRTRDALDVVVANVRAAVAELDVPLALENPAALLRWPDDEIDTADFLTEIAERTGALLLVDLANLHADAVNHGVDAARLLARLPWERVAYLHVAGGLRHGGLYHDTHRHPVPAEVVDLLRDAAERGAGGPAFLLERDGDYPSAAEFHAELDMLTTAVAAGVPPDIPPPAAGPSPMITDSTAAARARLAARQAELATALVAGGPAPAGFDAGRLAATRHALVDKRRAAVTSAWPALAALPDFAAAFAAFADAAFADAAFADGRPPAGSRADGIAFARSVYADLDEPARAELLAAVTAHRRFALRLDRHPRGRTLLLLRFPGIGTRILEAPTLRVHLTDTSWPPAATGRPLLSHRHR